MSKTVDIFEVPEVYFPIDFNELKTIYNHHSYKTKQNAPHSDYTGLDMVACSIAPSIAGVIVGGVVGITISISTPGVTQTVTGEVTTGISTTVVAGIAGAITSETVSGDPQGGC